MHILGPRGWRSLVGLFPHIRAFLGWFLVGIVRESSCRVNSYTCEGGLVCYFLSFLVYKSLVYIPIVGEDCLSLTFPFHPRVWKIWWEQAQGIIVFFNFVCFLVKVGNMVFGGPFCALVYKQLCPNVNFQRDSQYNFIFHILCQQNFIFNILYPLNHWFINYMY